MSKKWRLTGGVIVLLVVAGGISAVRTSEGKTRRLHVVNPELPFHQQPQFVGWVFGRLMGFPGAEKPLMIQTGMGFRPPPPEKRQ